MIKKDCEKKTVQSEITVFINSKIILKELL